MGDAGTVRAGMPEPHPMVSEPENGSQRISCYTEADPQHPSRLRWQLRSATQTEALDQRAVAGDVDLGDVLEQPAATADQQQQATT